MVDATKFLKGCVKKREVVGIGSHIAVNKLDGGRVGMQLFLEDQGWFVEEIAEEDLSSNSVKKADEVSTYSNCALVI